MFQETYEQSFGDILPDAAFLQRLDERMHSRRSHRRAPRRFSAALALAIAALLILTTGALAASGTLERLFAAFSSHGRYDFGRIDSHSAEFPLAQTLTLPNGATAGVVLEQAYYNGEQLALAWRLNSDPSQLRFIPQADFTPAANQSKAFDFYPWITAEAREEFERRFAEDGFACVSYAQCHFDGGLYLLSSDALPDSLAEAARYHAHREFLGMHETGDTDGGSYALDISTSGRLPEDYRDQQQISITRYIGCTVYYFYRDSTGQYSGSFDKVYFPVGAVIPRTDEYRSLDIRRRVEFPDHTADIVLTSSPIQAHLSITNWLSDNWRQVWDAWWPEHAYQIIDLPLNLSEDVIVQYRVFIDGEAISQSRYWYDAAGFSAKFVLPDDAQTLTLRPVYANSGEHPDEDISLSLTE